MKTGITKQTIVVSLVLLSVAACAPTKQPPSSQMALSQAAVENATAAGAYEYAPVELKSSRDKISKASEAVQAKDYVTAERLLEQAEIDARLAEAKSKTAKSEKAVEELQKSIDMMRHEIQRKTAG